MIRQYLQVATPPLVFHQKECHGSTNTSIFNRKLCELEQLECLCSEDTPRRLMITHYRVIWDPKSKEDKVKVTNLKNLPKFLILTQTLHAKHRRTRWNQYTPPFNFVDSGVIMSAQHRKCPGWTSLVFCAGNYLISPVWREGGCLYCTQGQ